jgi:phosphoenolpyruvate-protein kinase (PTS system EI component)
MENGLVLHHVLKKVIIQNFAKLLAEGIVEYKIGTMIEVPRTALCADELAQECDFMSCMFCNPPSPIL